MTRNKNYIIDDMKKADIEKVVRLSQKVILEVYPDSKKLEVMQANNIEKYNSLLCLMNFENEHRDSIGIKNYIKIAKDEHLKIVALLRGRLYIEKKEFKVDWICKDLEVNNKEITVKLIKSIIKSIKKEGYVVNIVKASSRGYLVNAIRYYQRIGLDITSETDERIDFVGKVEKMEKIMRLGTIPRIFWANLPTPFERLNNISSQFKDTTIFIKREDLTGHCFGGNKERKLEFMMADVLKKKATVIVTVGTLQSNHCRMTTAFSNKLGLKTELILIENERDEGIKKGGNFFLCELLGAKIHTVKVNEVKDKIEELLNNLRDNGEEPYFIEGGGHNVLGTLGYIYAIRELKKQTEETEVSPDYLVLPTGTGTTQAGLILGTKIFDYDIEIVGISVARGKERCIGEISTIIKKTKEYLDIDSWDYNPQINVYDDYIGEGYGISTKESMKALKSLAEKEGLVIDPIYNAKATAGMFDLISKGRLKGIVIYLNTGGLPALFTEKYFNWGI